MKLTILLSLSALTFCAPQAGQGSLGTQSELVTSSSVVPLTHTAVVNMIGDRSLQLEPGVRLTKTGVIYNLSTYGEGKVEFEAGSERVSLASPVSATLKEDGWDLGTGKTYKWTNVVARRHQQDDADSNLKSMQESAKKLKNNSNNQSANRKLRVRFLYGESNPMVTAELFNSQAIQQLVHCSPSGF